MLEELAAAYGLGYGFSLVDLRAGEQKSAWFLRINPNGRIPTLVDNALSPPLALHESSAQLVYLQERYDPENHFGFADVRERSEMMQWLFFWHRQRRAVHGQRGLLFARRDEGAVRHRSVPQRDAARLRRAGD